MHQLIEKDYDVIKKVTPRAEVIDELYQAVAHGKAPLHDAAWGQATVEVLLAMLQSARDGRDIRLK